MPLSPLMWAHPGLSTRGVAGPPMVHTIPWRPALALGLQLTPALHVAPARTPSWTGRCRRWTPIRGAGCCGPDPCPLPAGSCPSPAAPPAGATGTCRGPALAQAPLRSAPHPGPYPHGGRDSPKAQGSCFASAPAPASPGLATSPPAWEPPGRAGRGRRGPAPLSGLGSAPPPRGRALGHAPAPASPRQLCAPCRAPSLSARRAARSARRVPQAGERPTLPPWH